MTCEFIDFFRLENRVLKFLCILFLVIIILRSMKFFILLSSDNLLHLFDILSQIDTSIERSFFESDSAFICFIIIRQAIRFFVQSPFLKHQIEFLFFLQQTFFYPNGFHYIIWELLFSYFVGIRILGLSQIQRFLILSNFIRLQNPRQMNVMQGYSSNKRNQNAYLQQPQNFEINNTLTDLHPMPSHQPMYPPFQSDPYVQQNASLQINTAVQQGFGGFGQYYFNALDPNIAKTNVPIKQQSSMHGAIIAATLILIVGFGAGIGIIVVKPELLTYGGIAIGAGYVIYIVSALACSTIRGYITNLKKFDQYKQTYDKMVKGRGYFRFWIECYHYRTSGKKSKSRNKVVTHTATENFYPSFCVDESGNVQGIKDVKQYVFINYQKKMYFNDPRGQSIVQNAFNSFVARNKKDTHQNHTNTFEIEGFEPEVGFCMQGKSPHNSIIFYILSFLGLALPYACLLERSVSRYEINILKKLTY